MEIPRLDHSAFRKTVEEALNIELTDSYATFIRGLVKSRDPKAVATCYEIACDPERVIEMNRAVESSHINDFPDSYFVIGESGCGDFYAIDLDDECSGVYFWNHESGTFQGDEDFHDLEEFGLNFLPPDA